MPFAPVHGGTKWFSHNLFLISREYWTPIKKWLMVQYAFHRDCLRPTADRWVLIKVILVLMSRNSTVLPAYIELVFCRLTLLYTSVWFLLTVQYFWRLDDLPACAQSFGAGNCSLQLRCRQYFKLTKNSLKLRVLIQMTSAHSQSLHVWYPPWDDWCVIFYSANRKQATVAHPLDGNVLERFWSADWECGRI